MVIGRLLTLARENPSSLTQSEIEEILSLANEKYREGAPLLSDEDFDGLEDYLKEKYPNSEWFKRGIKDYSGKVELPIKMNSLNKVKNVKELKNWIESKGIRPDEILVLTPKFDGLSLLVYEGYVSRYSKRSWTRGDGKFGVEVSKHYSFVDGFDPKINVSQFSIGEAIISKHKFETKWKGIYANPRNMVASLFNVKKPEGKKLNYVNYFRFGFVDEKGKETEDKLRQIDLLNSNLNSIQLPFKYVRVGEFLVRWKDEDMSLLYNEWNKYFEIDGIVVECNSCDLRKLLGKESNENPAYARAYKGNFEEIKETTIEKIVWEITKGALIKPVGKITPVILDGAKVSNVSLYNANYILENEYFPGAKVKIKRSGKVIPQILELVSSTTKDYDIDSDIEKQLNISREDYEWSGDNAVDLYYLKYHDDQVIREIEFFFDTLGFENISRKTIKKLFKAGFDSLYKILTVSAYLLELKVEGFARKSSVDFCYQISRRLKYVPLNKLKAASNCYEGIGEKTLNAIPFALKPEFNKWFDLIKYPGISSITMGGIKEGEQIFWEEWYPKYKDIITYKYESPEIPKSGICKGWKVIFTGFRSATLEDIIKMNAGEVMTSVSQYTTHLIIADVNVTSNKTKKALELNKKIKMMTKEQLEAFFKRPR